MHLKDFTNTLKVAAEENRLRILCILYQKKNASVGMIARELRLSVATTSHHLLTLEALNLVTRKRFGQEIHYNIQASSFTKKFKVFLCSQVTLS